MNDPRGGPRSGGVGDPDEVRRLDDEGEGPEDRALRAELQALPLEAEPSRDLWPGIQGRLRPRGASDESHPQGGGGGSGAISLQERRGRRPARLSLSWGQAAAAGLVLMLASGSLVWVGLRGGGGGEIPAVASGAGPEGSGGEVADARFVAAEEAFGEYDLAVSDLRRIVSEASDELEPETVQILEENLATVEAALAEAREALLADPSGEMMSRLLSGTMRRRLGVLRQAVAMAVAQS